MHLETETMEKILVDLGYNLQDKGRYWQSNAVYREGDNKSALIIWKDTGMWKDFVASTRYSSFKKLVSLSGAKSPEKVDEYIKKIDSGTEWYFDRPKVHKMEFQEIFSSNEVDTLLPHYSFYNKKGISDDVLRKLFSGFSMSGKFNGRYTFGIFSENGKIAGLAGRHLLWREGCSFPKWKIIGRKSNFLYPVYVPGENSSMPFLDSIQKSKSLILVESIGDSLFLIENGLLNNLVLFGTQISSKQISFIVSQSLDKIIIALNKDKNRIGLINSIRIFLSLINFIDIQKIEIRLPILKDFGEMGQKKIPIEQWTNRQISKKDQIKYILEIKDPLIIITHCQRKILQSFLNEL